MKTKLIFIVAALALLWPRGAEAGGACTAARFHDWKDMGCNQNYAGAGGPATGKSGAGGNQSKCNGDCGMPRWWVSEPYLNLFMSDTPLSYKMSSGQDMAFTFYYRQRPKLPDADEVPDYWHLRGDLYPSPGNRATVGTNAFWGNNWNQSIQFWDSPWENAWAVYYGTNVVLARPNYAPFSHGNYEAFVYQPEGSIDYYYMSNGVSGLKNSQTLTLLQPLSNGGYPLTTNAPTADTNKIYWGDNNVGFKMVYPDASQDVFSLNVYANSSSQNSTARVFLTQKIDPQGRITRVGYERFYSFYTYLYRVKFVVDPDNRTNTFQYATNFSAFNNYTPPNPWELSEVDDPYGRKVQLGYDFDSGILTSITDAAGLTSSFQYQLPTVTSNYYIYGGGCGQSVCPTNIAGLGGNGKGWITNLTTPYGSTSFSYYQTLDPSATNVDAIMQRAIYVSEPTGAQQLYYYLHSGYDTNNQPLLTTTATAPTIPGQTNFDDGSSGGHAQLNYRNSIYWGRRQFSALSSSVLASLPSNMSNALANLTASDFKKGRIRNWLFQSDAYSISDALSSEREPSPDAAGQIEDTYRTWYNYANKTSQEALGSSSQVSCIAQSLPDGTSQFTTYNYYGGTGLVSDNESSYSKPDNSIGVLTNWFHYSGDNVDLLSVSNSAGQFVNYGYNGSHQITAITNALNQVTTLTWDGYTFNLTAVLLPDGQSITLNLNYNGSYGTNGFVPGPYFGFVQGISWSPSGRSFTINSYNAGLPANVTDDRGLTVSNTWDGLNRLTGTGFPDNTSISNIYNRLDLVASKDRLANWTYYAYDGLQHLTTVTNANNAVTAYSWCGCGSLTAILDALTNLTTLNYDNQGNQTGITFPDYSSVTNQYDLAGRMTNVADGTGRYLRLGYNNQGLPITVTGANGLLRHTIYDALNRPMSTTDANGITMTNQYDALNELLKRTWPDGLSEGYGYTAAGLIAYTNRDQKITWYGRDGAGRLTSVTNANTEVTQFGYDSLNNMTSLIDGLLHQTTWQYNQYGWLTNKTDGLTRNVERFTFNANGWITNRWTPEKGNTGYTFDNVGNLKSIVYPQQTNSFAYDALNRLTNMVDAVGTTAFSYTPAGRLQSENEPWANDTLTYTYVQGLRTALTLSQTTSNWSQSYGYDSGWRMNSITSPAGTFGYSYTFQPASSLVTGIQLPNGASIANSYDSLARLTGTALNNHWNHALDSYTYTPDALGLRTNIVRNLGLTSSTVTAGFDNIGQLTSWNATEIGGTPRQNEQLGFGYDAAHNLHTRNNGNLAQTFTTDAANELTGVTRTGTFTESGATPAPATSVTVNGLAAQTYGDFTFAATNLSLASGNNTFTNIAQNVYGVKATNILTLNLPLSVTLNSDGNGSLTNDGARSFGYDSENQLTNITLAGSWKSDFVYDGFNRRRIARDFAWQSGAWVLTNETHYIYDGRLLIQERGTNNNSLVTYTRGLDLGGSLRRAGGIGGLLARTDTNGSTFYHADGVGNITALIDGQENIVARYLYNPFGKVVGQWGPLAPVNAMQFSSKPRYRGLDDFGLRWNDSDLDRWLNQDPIGENGGLNLYGYVGNNPINNIDPLGLAPNGDDDDPTDRMLNRLDSGNYSQGGARWTPEETKQAGNEAKQVGIDAAMIIAGAVTGGGPELNELKGVPGTYKVCLKNGKSYVGKAVDMAKRLASHVRNGKWKWDDIKAIFTEEANTEKMRRIREAQRLMEETGGLHPSEAPNVLNKIMPPKP